MSEVHTQQFNRILQSFSIGAVCLDYQKINHYSFYDVKLHPSAKVKDIIRRSDEISLALKAPCRPRIRTLHDKGLVRVEFITTREEPLYLLDLFTNNKVPNMELPCLLGQTLDGNHMWMDLAQNPHLLIAGTTGSGKTTLMHNIIANLLNYNDVSMFLIDPKSIEFNKYEKKMRSTYVYYSYDDALRLVNHALDEMESRYQLLRRGTPITDFKHAIIIIDEFADLIMQDKDDVFYDVLCRLAQKCRAARMHIILGTQRPSVNIVKGSIKANFPARIACRVATHVDSKVILDATGAENLLGKGDALLRDNLRVMERFQTAYITPEEVCHFFGEKNGISGA